MPAPLNYTTKIDAAKSAMELQNALVKHGADRIAMRYDAGHLVGLSFTIPTAVGVRAFTIPANVDAMQRLMKIKGDAGQLPSLSKAMRSSREQAERVAWRVLRDWMMAQLTLVDTEMVTIDQVMLPYLVTDDGQTTLYEAFRSSALELTRGEEA